MPESIAAPAAPSGDIGRTPTLLETLSQQGVDVTGAPTITGRNLPPIVQEEAGKPRKEKKEEPKPEVKDDGLRPSATIDEALERLSDTALNAVNEARRQRDTYKELAAVLTQRLDIAHRQRDELAACLRDFRQRFCDGDYTYAGETDGTKIHRLALLLARCDTALLRCDVRERLDERLDAERKGEAS